MISYNRKRYASGDRVLQIIKEEIDRLILSEEYSISDTVMKCASDICSVIKDMYDNDSHTSCIPVRILKRRNDGSYIPGETVIKEFNLQLSDNIKKKISKLVSVTVFVIELDDFDTYRVNYDDINIGGKYSLNGHTVTINTIALGGQLRDRMLYQSLLHEIEHAYQYSLANQTDYRHLLAIANKNLDNPDPVIKSTASLLYYFNPREIDANIQSFYDDLNYINPEHIDDIGKTELISERDQYIKRYYSYLKSLPPEQVTSIIKPIFRIDADFLFKYIGKQIRYFNKKIMRVYHLYNKNKKDKDILILRNESKSLYIR